MNRPHLLSKLRKIKMNSTKTKSSRTSRFQSLTPRILLSLSYDTLTAHLLLRPSLANLAHGETRLRGLGCSSPIYRIYLYSVDGTISFLNINPLDSDLSGG